MKVHLRLALLAPVLAGCGAAPLGGPEATLRVATFNIWELSTTKLDHRDASGAGIDSQATAAATLLKHIRPDIVFINEIDHDDRFPDDLARTARQFVERYLRTGAQPLDYPYVYAAPSNTGVLSGLDLDQNGIVATAAMRGERAHGDDSWGFGTYPGQYAMAVLSRYPIATSQVRTFQRLKWKDFPGHHMPVGFWPDSVAVQVRLSSKSHWDVPVVIGRDTLHLLGSHPTPPSFDGREDRNGRRNFDEIGFWARYLDGSTALVDDRGERGGLAADAAFVIVGDLNADPARADTLYDGVRAMAQLIGHRRVQEPPQHQGRNTAAFLGGTRVDYVLPARSLTVVGGGVFNPDPTADPDGAAMARAASDHRLVWVDLRLPLRASR